MKDKKPKIIKIFASEIMGKPRESIGIKTFMGATKKFLSHTIKGWFPSKREDLSPDGVNKERVIDRINNRYKELVTDEKTGRVIHDVEEKLTDHRLNIFEELKKLDLPKGEYVVIGSGTMGALKIREIKDVDLIVSPKLFDKLQSEGWEYSEVEIEGRMRKKLSKGVAEAFRDFWYNNEDQDTAKIIAEAELIEGYPFVPLLELLKFKKTLTREKNKEDVLLIDKYLSK